jgi:hypothetical protein
VRSCHGPAAVGLRTTCAGPRIALLPVTLRRIALELNEHVTDDRWQIKITNDHVCYSCELSAHVDGAVVQASGNGFSHAVAGGEAFRKLELAAISTARHASWSTFVAARETGDQALTPQFVGRLIDVVTMLTLVAPPWPQLSTIEVAALSDVDVELLATIRSAGWSGIVVAIGTKSLQRERLRCAIKYVGTAASVDNLVGTSGSRRERGAPDPIALPEAAQLC